MGMGRCLLCALILIGCSHRAIPKCDYRNGDLPCVKYKTDHGKHVKTFIIIFVLGYSLGLQFNEYDKRP